MTNEPSVVLQFASAEMQARHLETEAREQAAQAGITKALRAVNKELGEHLTHANGKGFDTIRVDGDTHRTPAGKGNSRAPS